MTLMRGVQAGHTRALRDLLQDQRVMRAAMTEMTKEKITPSEVEVLHGDMSKLPVEVSEIRGRLEIVEARDQH
jgi:hypothetical protein